MTFSLLFSWYVHSTPRSGQSSMSTPETSQTDSDVSPQIIRRRRPHMKDVIPRFSISVEEDRSQQEKKGLNDDSINQNLTHW